MWNRRAVDGRYIIPWEEEENKKIRIDMPPAATKWWTREKSERALQPPRRGRGWA